MNHRYFFSIWASLQGEHPVVSAPISLDVLHQGKQAPQITSCYTFMQVNTRSGIDFYFSSKYSSLQGCSTEQSTIMLKHYFKNILNYLPFLQSMSLLASHSLLIGLFKKETPSSMSAHPPTCYLLHLFVLDPLTLQPLLPHTEKTESVSLGKGGNNAGEH